ncbi:MAG: SLC13 family permease [Anaerovoracaceae bacterium]
MTDVIKRPGKNNIVRAINLLIGPLLFVICAALLPHDVFETLSSREAIGTVAWMAYWWITAPVDFAVTGFLPIAINVICQMCDMELVIANYASEIVLLLLGASIITVSWELTGLDKRIASWFLIFIGSNLRKQVMFWFLLTAALSSVLPNAVVCAAITPIAVAMLKYIGIDEVKSSNAASMILLTIAYGAGVGGLASPLGGAMNLVTVDYLQKLTGSEFIYWHWVVRFLPLMAVLIISNIIYLAFLCKKEENLGGSHEFFKAQYKEMGRMTSGEKWALGLFLVAVILAFTRQLYQDALPGLKPAYVFIVCAILAFIVTKNDGTRLITWRTAEKAVRWIP